MNQIENSSNLSERGYRPKYPENCRLTEDLNLLKSLPYLQNFVSNLESETLKYYATKLKRRLKRYNIEYERLINFCDWELIHYSTQLHLYKIIYEHTIFELTSHKNVELLLCGLRLLFAFPSYFNVIEKSKFTILVNNLIDFAIFEEEPQSTNAIKCLQYASNKCKRDKIKFPRLHFFVTILMKRIISIMKIKDDDKLVKCLEFKDSNYEKNKWDFVETKIKYGNRTLEELKIDKFDVFRFLKACPAIDTCTNVFHSITLLNSFISQLKISQLSENELLVDLLCSCIDVNICKEEGAIIQALHIILRCSKDSKFMLKFISLGGVLKVCLVPHTAFCSYYAQTILNRLSTNKIYVEEILNYQHHLIELMIMFSLDTYLSSEKVNPSIFFLNVLNHQEIYEKFVEIKGINILLNRIGLTRGVRVIKEQQYYHQLRKFFDYFNPCMLDDIVKIFFFHIFNAITSLAPDKIKDVICYPSVRNLDYGICDILLEYFEKNGGIRFYFQSFEDILKTETFEIVVLILRVIYQCKLNRGKRIYQEMYYIMKFLTLYHKTAYAFMHSYCFHLNQLPKGHNLIRFLSMIYEKYNKCTQNDYVKFLPFNIYHNLLVTCFPDIKICKNLIKLKSHSSSGNHGEWNFVFDETSNRLIDTLLRHSIISNSCKSLLKFNICYVEKIYALKCLLILSIKPHVMQIISVIFQPCILEFASTIFTLTNNDNQDYQLKKYTKYATIFIFKIYTYWKKPNLKPKEIQNSKDDDPNLSTTHKNIMNTFTDKDSIKLSSNSRKMLMSHLYQNIQSIYSEETKVENKSQLFLKNQFFNRRKNQNIYRHGLKYYTRLFKNISTKNTCSFIELSSSDSTKILIDDNIIVALRNGIFDTTKKKISYLASEPRIYSLEDSYNGEYIVGCGITLQNNLFTNIWKYEPSNSLVGIPPKEIFPGINYSKISHNNNFIFGVTNDLNAHIFDFEKANIITKFSNENRLNYTKFNTIEINQEDNLILFSGHLFCTRSGKSVYDFYKFEQHISGIFLNSDFNVLINTELWDLRTFRLYERVAGFEDMVIKKTYNEDILIGIPILKRYELYEMEYEFHNWFLTNPTFKNHFQIYHSRTFTQIEKKEFSEPITFVDISRSCNKVIVNSKTGNTHILY